MVRHESAVSAPSVTGSPVRTCIGCRERALTVDLLRVVARRVETDGNEFDGFDVVPDLRLRMPGRGAWLHPTPSCLSKAERRRAFGRALRVSGHLDFSAVTRLVESDRHGTHRTQGTTFEKNRHEHT